MKQQRRNFLKTALLAGAAGGLQRLTQGASASEGIPHYLEQFYQQYGNADEIVRIGLIGGKGMGWSNLNALLKVPGVQCTAICDVDESVIKERMEELRKRNIVPKVFQNYRELIQSSEVDAVVIATPDHWHCLMLVEACAAGKHVYVEKPLSNSVDEAQQMLAAAKKYQRIVQVNQWQRSQKHFKDAISFVHSGKLGNIYTVKTWFFRGGGEPLTPVADGAVPDGVDYKMWLGPAVQRPFNSNRFHYNFRWFWDYAGGLMTDWGVHLFDIALWGMKAGDPLSVTCSGAKYKFPNDAKETPDFQTALYDYGSFQLTWEHSMGKGQFYGKPHGIAFIGEKGTLIVNRAGWEVVPEMEKDKPLVEKVDWQPRVDSGLDLHAINFIAAIREKNSSLLNCPIEAGAKVAMHCHLGNIALRSGEKIYWKNNTLTGASKKTKKLLKPVYHNGYQYPKIS